MATIATTDGRFSVNATTTDAEAAAACRRIPADHRDAQFGHSLARDFARFGSLTQNKRVWLHRLAESQVAREVRAQIAATPPAPVSTPAPTPAPVVPAPVPAPVVPAPVPAPVVPAPVPAPVVPLEGEVSEDTVEESAWYSLGYDIPDAAEIENPSGFLRRRAIRVRKSEWLIHGKNIPWTLVHNLRQAGSTVDIVPQHPRAEKQLVKMAVRAMTKELNDQIRRAERSQEIATAAFDAPEGNVEKKRDKFLKAADEIQNRIEAMTDDYRVACQNFNLNADQLFPLGTARRQVGKVRAAMMNRAGLYVAAANFLRELGTADAAEMVRQMDRDAVPAEIAADFVEDNGGDASALREAFGQETDA